MTSVPARRFGIRRRGVIERGAFADIAVWREGEFKSRSTYDAPHAFSSGVEFVMVNGKVPYAGGKFTGERGGRFLER
jgi:N-acyl-D-amino-acid deacylase